MRPEIVTAVAGVVVGWLSANAINKTPGVRVLDVVVLGPFLVIMSVTPTLSKEQRLALAFSGGATVGYNLKNYLGNLRP